MTRRGFLQSTLLSLTVMTTRRFASPILLPERLLLPVGGERLFTLAGKPQGIWVLREVFNEIDIPEWIEILNGRQPVPNGTLFVDKADPTLVAMGTPIINAPIQMPFLHPT